MLLGLSSNSRVIYKNAYWIVSIMNNTYVVYSKNTKQRKFYSSYADVIDVLNTKVANV